VFFKTFFILMAMVIFLMGALLLEAVLRERAYARRLLLGMIVLYALGGMTALVFSIANL